MSDILGNEILLLLADVLVLVPTILGLYILVLAPRQRANQAVAGYVLLLAFVNFSVALSLRALNLESANFGLRLYAAIAPASGPATLFLTLYLLKPEWLRGSYRIWRRLLWSIILLPTALLLLDTLLGTQIYYVSPAMWQQGTLPTLRILTNTPLGNIVRSLAIIPVQIFVLMVLVWLAIRGKLSQTRRNLARLMLFAQFMAGALTYIFLVSGIRRGMAIIAIGTLYAVVYASVAYRREFVEITAQIGLQPRLTSLILVIVLPVIAFLTISANSLVYTLTRLSADTRLQDIGNLTAAEVEQWLNFNTDALQGMARQPEITSLDPALQEPVLRSMDVSHGYMYLVSTTDVLGRNIARSDGAPLMDYNDRLWVQKALRGQSPALQVLIGRTSHKPALVVATPIRNESNGIIGVAMFASTLDDLTKTILSTHIGQSGYAYLTDESGTLLAHPKMANVELYQLEDYSKNPPVANLLQAHARTWMTYADSNGIVWRAYLVPLANGWNVVLQQQEREILAPARLFTNLSTGVVIIIGLVLFGLVWASIRHIVVPIEALTTTAQAIASGNLEQRALENSTDELGILAKTINQMADRLQASIQDLETRVAERTLRLEHRSAQLQAVTEISSAISNEPNLEALLPLITQRISQRFGFYHVGIFLLDEKRKYAILKAANSAGGQRMLARQHRLRVGMQGLVGYSAFTRQVRIARDVGLDAVHFDNPDLPDTRSEMALPLTIGSRVLGVLDVQSTQSDAFGEDDTQILQALADQVAVAIQNATLIEESRQLLETQQAALGQFDQHAWQRQIEVLASPAAQRNPSGLRLLKDAAPSLGDLPPEGMVDPQDAHLFHIPLRVRDLTIGSLQARKPADQPPWSQHEIVFLQTLSAELGQALDSARLAQETRLSAWQQKVTIETAARLRQNLDLENILRTTIAQIQQTLNLPEVQIQIGAHPEESA
ncbi:MAG: hypothetical protein Fur0018_12590 [Anaerolineales bacterium]